MSIDNSHENIIRSDEVKSGSDRAFGFVFAVVFLLIGLLPFLNDNPIRLWAVIIAVALIVISLTLPRILSPFNRVWFKFGLLLHKIVSPIIMGVLFYLTVTPMALIMRLLGKPPLSLSFDKSAKSYWIHRDPPGPEPDSIKRQF